MDTKICSRCGIEKTTDCFRKRWYGKYNKYYLYSHCKECEKEYDNNKGKENKRKYYEKHIEEVKARSKKQRLDNHTEYVEYMREYYKENKEVLLNKQKRYVQENLEKTKKYQSEYAAAHKEDKKKYDKKYFLDNKEKILRRIYYKYVNDEIYRFKQQIRNLIYDSFKRKGYTKKSKTFDIVGIPSKELKVYLLGTYRKNYNIEWDGKVPVHIDHIIPLATAKNEDDIIKLCHYSNLQLLTAKDNLEKNDKLDWKKEVR